MPLTLPAPPDLEPGFWAQAEIIDAVHDGHLAAFLLAVRGARRPRWSQDQLARWIGCTQSTVSDLERGRPVAEPRLYGILEGLHVPSDLVRTWGR
jgi:hypothetical protein